MIADHPAWRVYPIFRELFLQWRAARASAPPGAFQHPFRRDWEALLEDAHLISGEARREADRDARALCAVGLAQLKTIRYRPYQIERIAIPLEAEARLRTLFADELPDTNATPFDPATVEWQPELSFLRSVRIGIACEDLLKLNAFFASRETRCLTVPVKERSVEIFGDEKRLDALRTTTIFAEGRLTLEQLCCFAVAEPLGWKRGPRNSGPLLVIENASTWDSYCRWNKEHGLFSAVVYGGGNRFLDSAVRLADVFAEVGGPREVLYFGDLDPPGLRIPQAASQRTHRQGLPPIHPHLWSYATLLDFASHKAVAMVDTDRIEPAQLTWLGDLAARAQTLFDSGRRIAQENLGWDYLSRSKLPNDVQS